MATSLGTIPEDFGINDLWTVNLGTVLPAAVSGRRPVVEELIWDSDSGFTDAWVDRSSLSGDGMGGYVMILARRAFSAAGLALYAYGVAGGGSGGTLAGDVTGPAGTNTVAKIQGVTVDLTGHVDGNALTFVGGQIKPAPGGGGSGDVVGPASAVTARLATFNGTTGKLIQDGGKTLANIAADIAAAVAAAPSGAWTRLVDINYTQLSALTLSNGVVTLGGVPHTIANVGNMAYSRIDATGMTSKASASSSENYFAQASTGFTAKINLADIAPNFVVGQSELRVWWQGGSNGNQNHESAPMGIMKSPWTGGVSSQASWTFNPGAYDSVNPHNGIIIGHGTATRADVDLTSLTAANSLNAVWGLHVKSPANIEFYVYTTAAADSASNDTAARWPQLKLAATINEYTGAVGSSSITATSGYAIKTAADLDICVLAISSFNTAAHMIGTVKRLVVEVKY